MVGFTFRTQGFEVGYGEEGIFAFGETDDHEWHDRDYPDPVPSMRRELLMWRIDVSAQSQWKQYAEWLSPEKQTPRQECLRAFWDQAGLPVGRMQRNHDAHAGVALTYSLPNDPSLAIFLLSAQAIGRELLIYCAGFHFLHEERLAPAPSLAGFDQRGEPAFISQRPILRLR